MKRLLTALLFLAGLALGKAVLSVILQEGAEFEDTASKRAVQVPYVTKEEAEKLEQAISEAWNKFDARTYYRVNAAINGKSACTNRQDKELGAWEGSEKTLSSDEFCDGSVPENPVPWSPMVCPKVWVDWGELAKRYTEAISHATQVYYKDYLDEVEKALDKHAPKALLWSDYRVPGAGSALIPVEDKNGKGNWSTLSSKDKVYYEQALPGMEVLRRDLAKRSRGGIEPPGDQSKEREKPAITDRSSIFPSGKSFYWAGQSGGPKPEGDAGLAPSGDYEAYGVLPVMRLKAELVAEPSPRQGGVVILMTACLAPPFGTPVSVPIPVPVVKPPVPRVTTAWEALVEGYEVKDVFGLPRLRK